MDDIVRMVLTAVVTGAVSSLATIAAINVKLEWLRRDLDRLERRVDTWAIPPSNP